MHLRHSYHSGSGCFVFRDCLNLLKDSGSDLFTLSLDENIKRCFNSPFRREISSLKSSAGKNDVFAGVEMMICQASNFR